jgi:hypothetical protein
MTPINWSPKDAAFAALLVLAFPKSHLYTQAVAADPTFKPLLDHFTERRIRWHFIDASPEEIIAIGRAYDAAGDYQLSEMWWHGLSGESVELFWPPAEYLRTEPDMANLLACEGRPWTSKYLARWPEVRRELRALLDDPWMRMAAMARPDRLRIAGIAEDKPEPQVTTTDLRRHGLGFAADALEECERVDAALAARFPNLN